MTSFRVRLGAAVAVATSTACASAPNPKARIDETSAAPARRSAAEDFATEVAALPRITESADSAVWEQVADRMKALVERHPRYAPAWYNLGVAYQALDRPEEAADAYRRALVVDEGLLEARNNLAGLAIARGDADEAVTHLQAVVASDPGRAAARVALATYQLDRDALDDAERLAKEALARAPKRIGGYCVLAQVYVKREDYGRARLVVAQGLKLDENAACLHLALGRVLLAEEKTALALVALERAVKNDPSLSEARFLIAETSMAFKDFNKAIVHYRAVAAQARTPGPALVNLGVAYKGSGRFVEAEKAYLAAVEHADAAAAAHFNLGVLYLRHLNRLAPAETHLKRFVDLAGEARSDAAPFLDEIEQMKRFKAREAALAEEAARQAEIDEKVAAEEAAKAEETEEEAGSTPPVPASAPLRGRESPKKKRKAKKPPPEILTPDDFE